MRCNAIIVVVAIVAVASIAGIKELCRWLQNRRYKRNVRIETVCYGRSH